MTNYNYDIALPVDFEYDLSFFQNHYQTHYAKSIAVGYGDENPANVPYFKSLMDKYDFLDNHLGWFKILPAYTFPLHIDKTEQYPRNAVLNIPVYDCDEHTSTNYYDIPEDDPNWDQPSTTNQMMSRAMWYNVIRCGPANMPKPVYTFNCTEPTLLNVTLPHDVKNRGRKTRVLASWHIKPNKFDQARDYLESKGLIKQWR